MNHPAQPAPEEKRANIAPTCHHCSGTGQSRWVGGEAGAGAVTACDYCGGTGRIEQSPSLLSVRDAPNWERALSDLERIAMQDYETMASGKKTLTAIRHLRYVLQTPAQPDAALRARCERLEGALGALLDAVDYTAGNCRPNEMVGGVLPKVLIVNARAALAQLKEGAP